MEVPLENSPTCMAIGTDNRIVLGDVDGLLSMSHYDLEQQKMQVGWQFKLNASVRDAKFNLDNSEVYAICRNRAVCSFDVETGTRTRCIVRGTTDKPNVLCVLPTTARKHQQFSTGDEAGEIKSWDFRVPEPNVVTWKEQEEDINALVVDSKNNLISASSDGSLAAFDIRACKLRVKSETMHSEMLSLAITDKFVYAGGGDGYIEVFTHGEYGNLLERIESGFKNSVTSITELRKGLLLTSSEMTSKLRLLNVMPTKRLGVVGSHGELDEGVDKIAVSPDRKTLVSLCGMSSSVKFWPLDEILADVPILRANDVAKRKAIVREGFFDDLVTSTNNKKKRNDDDSDDDEDGSDAEDEDFGDEDDEDDDSEEEKVIVKKNGLKAQEDSDDEDEEDSDEEDEEEEDSD